MIDFNEDKVKQYKNQVKMYGKVYKKMLEEVLKVTDMVDDPESKRFILNQLLKDLLIRFFNECDPGPENGDPEEDYICDDCKNSLN